MMRPRSLDVSSVLSNDDLAEYDIISDGPRSLESSIADLGHVNATAADMHEPPPSQAARDKFDTVAISADDIQAYVKRAAPATADHFRRSADGDQRAVRVYVDGVFDPFQARDALQLRQAKLSFPCVHLMVGVFADDLCEQHQTPTWAAHTDRCELLRHCRWVDEVVPGAPWTITENFLRAERIDFVGIDEGSSVNPACDKERLRGYDLVKAVFAEGPDRLRRDGYTNKTDDGADPDTDGAQEPVSVRRSCEEHDQGRATPLAPTEPLATAVEADAETPFEEPMMDEFGTGIGI
ncbi:hypothetical protein B0H21DRAFT_834697 [Amylocystis lapponica]|nr:hypothetical protein B0H21DRAFT_834697 [Amylocystis lapponica]